MMMEDASDEQKIQNSEEEKYKIGIDSIIFEKTFGLKYLKNWKN